MTCHCNVLPVPHKIFRARDEDRTLFQAAPPLLFVAILAARNRDAKIRRSAARRLFSTRTTANGMSKKKFLTPQKKSRRLGTA